MNRYSFATLTLAAALLAFGSGHAVNAASDKDAPNTPATDIHGAPGNTPGFGGNSANPEGRGNGVNGGEGIHNISGGAPGQAGYNPAQDGIDPAGTAHGGLRDTTGTNSPLDD